jgi:hypothetical protein
MRTAPPESKLFHTIVIVGLSFASTACGSKESPDDLITGADSSAPPVDAGNNESLPDAEPEVLASADAAPENTITSGFGTSPSGAAVEASYAADSGRPDASRPFWPIYL